MRTFKITFILATLFAFVSCGNSTADRSVNVNTGNKASESVQESQSVVASSQSETEKNIDDRKINHSTGEDDETKTSKGSDKPVQLDKELFLQKVFDYESNPQKWVFEGDQPCIIDFYADWCGPCKRVAPIMDELAKEYQEKIDIYKIDTDKEKELAQVFGIRSIPSIMFCPAEGKPYMYKGAFPKEKYVELLKKHFEL
ncbi:MAG: thioredoxin [Bacteroidales bacterium]|nr:thioredoxin [Bacteroidales bacterium]